MSLHNTQIRLQIPPLMRAFSECSSKKIFKLSKKASRQRLQKSASLSSSKGDGITNVKKLIKPLQLKNYAIAKFASNSIFFWGFGVESTITSRAYVMSATSRPSTTNKQNNQRHPPQRASCCQSATWTSYGLCPCSFWALDECWCTRAAVNQSLRLPNFIIADGFCNALPYAIFTPRLEWI